MSTEAGWFLLIAVTCNMIRSWMLQYRIGKIEKQLEQDKIDRLKSIIGISHRGPL